jgi:hypothetical protein
MTKELIFRASQIPFCYFYLLYHNSYEIIKDFFRVSGKSFPGLDFCPVSAEKDGIFLRFPVQGQKPVFFLRFPLGISMAEEPAGARKTGLRAGKRPGKRAFQGFRM